MNTAEDSVPARRRNSKMATAFHGGLSSDGVFAILITAAVFAVYFPALRGTFVWDDEQWTTMLQPVLKDCAGLWKMWADPTVLQQYFPVTGTTFWLDHQLWHDSTTAAHVENVLLHIASALLFWRLLQKLQTPGARIAATIFALHPIMVESVAWIAERKNVLSMALFLGAMLAYGRHVRFWKDDGEQLTSSGGAYVLALALFALALLAKTSVFAMPALLLLLAWWKRGRLRMDRDVLPALPFLVLAIGFGLFILYWEKHHVGAEGADFDLGFAERFQVAGRALWFYVGKLLWPVGFCPVFPRWQLDATFPFQDPWFWLTLAGLTLMVAMRNQMGRGPVVAVLFYVGSLFPLLGFINAYGMIYSFVSYRWVYVPSLGPIALAGAGLGWVAARMAKPTLIVLPAAPALVVLSAVTWKDAAIYRDSETHWQATLAGNPNCWVACYDLGNDRYNADRWEEAIGLYQRALALRPGYTQAQNNLANALMKVNRLEEAVEHFNKALKLEPGLSTAHYNLANCLFMLDRLDEAAEQFRQCIALTPDFADAHNNLAVIHYRTGRLDEALAEYRKVIEINPKNADAHCNLAETLLQVNALREALDEYETALRLNPDQGTALARLAWIRATAQDASVRNGEEALRLAQHAEALAQGNDATVLRVLAAAFAENKQFDEAAATARRACGLPKMDDALREALQADVQRYELRLPTRN
jgi:tetratricopeptide (TPR) repeat protein